jgi:N4-gp56 family major capsid protein
MGNITKTTADKFVPEVWAADVMRHTRANLVMANLVKRYDNDVKSGGDVIHIPRLAEVSARDKSAGTDVTFDAATENEYTITVNKHKYFAFTLEEIVKVQSRYDLREEYTSAAGYALAKAVDTDLLGLYSGLSQSTPGNGVGGDGTAITDAGIIRAIELLDIANAPRDNRSFVIHPEAMADVRGLDKFTRYDATGSAGVQTGAQNGLVANAYGVNVYMSTNVAEVAGTPNDIKNLMFHKDFAGLAMQQAPRVWAEESVDALGWKVAISEIYGLSELRDDHAVIVTLDS